MKAGAFGQNAGGNWIAIGARASQSPHTSLLSQRWHATRACARCDTATGQAAATVAKFVDKPSRPLIAALLLAVSGCGGGAD